MKKLVILIVLTSSVMSLFINSSCKKKVPNYYVSQGLKDWGYFNAGSQWVYRNDSTGVKETVWENNTPQDIMIGTLHMELMIFQNTLISLNFHLYSTINHWSYLAFGQMSL